MQSFPSGSPHMVGRRSGSTSQRRKRNGKTVRMTPKKMNPQTNLRKERPNIILYHIIYFIGGVDCTFIKCILTNPLISLKLLQTSTTSTNFAWMIKHCSVNLVVRLKMQLNETTVHWPYEYYSITTYIISHSPCPGPTEISGPEFSVVQVNSQTTVNNHGTNIMLLTVFGEFTGKHRNPGPDIPVGPGHEF